MKYYYYYYYYYYYVVGRNSSILLVLITHLRHLQVNTELVRYITGSKYSTAIVTAVRYLWVAFHLSGFTHARIAACRSSARYIRFHTSGWKWLVQHNDLSYEHIITLNVIIDKEVNERKGKQRTLFAQWLGDGLPVSGQTYPAADGRWSVGSLRNGTVKSNGALNFGRNTIVHIMLCQ